MARTNVKELIADVLDFDTLSEFKTNLSVFEDTISSLAPTRQQSVKLQLKSALDTAKQLGEIKFTPAMNNALTSILNLNLVDSISDEEALVRSGVTKTKTQNLPAVQSKLPATVNKALSTKKFQPEWIAVKSLPGYLKSGIRAMGRQVFAPFTDVSIEDIFVLANLQGNGPSRIEEINLVVGWLKTHGVRKTEAELEFHENIPGYTAQVFIYTAAGYDFMFVQDNFGVYVYAYTGKSDKLLTRR